MTAVAERGPLTRDRDIFALPWAYSVSIPSQSSSSMPTVALGPAKTTSKISPPLSSLGISHISSSETLLEECRNGISLSPPRQAKRRPAVVMMESEDDDQPVGSRPTIHSQKRQKSNKSQSTGTHDEEFLTGKNGKAFRHLQEQREQLPIAGGGCYPQICIIMTWL